MPLILRVDIDKPYGRSNLIQKVLSKIREDYWLPPIETLGYLKHVKKFLEIINEEGIKAHLYFRKCTLPPKDWINGPLLSKHFLGHHAEDTRSLETLKREHEIIQSYFLPIQISSFNKHGSGSLKLGRYHYPEYEPDKYREWAGDIGVPFLFGNNELTKGSKGVSDQNGYYPNMFWIDREYPASEQLSMEEIVEKAIHNQIVIIIHPANFIADRRVATCMKKLLLLARQNGVRWETIKE